MHRIALRVKQNTRGRNLRKISGLGYTNNQQRNTSDDFLFDQDRSTKQTAGKDSKADSPSFIEKVLAGRPATANTTSTKGLQKVEITQDQEQREPEEDSPDTISASPKLSFDSLSVTYHRHIVRGQSRIRESY